MPSIAEFHWRALCLGALAALTLAACASTRPRDPRTFEALADASLPRSGFTREMLGAISDVVRESAVALVVEAVGREQGYDQTWAPGNRYYERVAELVERSMRPMLAGIDPTPYLERNLTRALEHHLSQEEASRLVELLAAPDGRRFAQYMDATMATGILSGIAGKTPHPFRARMAQRLEQMRPRLEAARDQSVLTDAERARLTEFSESRLGRKLGRAYTTWAQSLKGEWSADLQPRTQQVKRNLLRSAADLRAILREYELWRSGELRDI